MKNSKGKGNRFEREFSKELSKWFTHNQRDDIFWRTHSSGGRATMRQKRVGQKTTSGQDADIGATDPIGQPLIDMLTLELKNGYSKGPKEISFQGLLENRSISIKGFTEWLDQLLISKNNAKSPYWALIWKRDGVEPFVVTDDRLKDCILRSSRSVSKAHPQGVIYFHYKKSGINLHIIPVSLLWSCDPEALLIEMGQHPKINLSKW